MLLDALVRIWLDGDRRTWTFIVAGFFSAMLVANEIPAAAAFRGGEPDRALAGAAEDAACLPAACPAGDRGLFRHELDRRRSWKPAQMHRSEGDNWYDYPGSYWNNRQGIDQGEKSAAVYSLHVLVGHHGIFSLTPDLVAESAGRRPVAVARRAAFEAVVRSMAVGVTLVCLAFYIWYPTVDRNYGGNASGFRWVFWMAPMWLVLMLPAADLLSHRRWSRGVALCSWLSRPCLPAYPTWNAWSSPWIMNFLGYLGWL